MKRIIFTILFLLMCVPAFAIRVGNVESMIDDFMQVVYDSGELEAAVTDLTVSGLASDTDEMYQLITNVVCGNVATDADFLISFNGDYGSNYGYQFLRATNSTSDADRGSTTGMIFGNLTQSGSVCLSEAIIYAPEDLTKTGIFTYANELTQTNVNRIVLNGQVWNSTDEITSITYHSNQANGFGVGSRFIILKKNANDYAA